MEDIKQYIESGVLELYILDTLNSEEKFEVESMAAKYPAVQKELDEIAESMELFAEQNAIEPSEDLRNTILNQLVNNNAAESIFTTIPSISPDKKVISLQPVRQNYFYKYAFAASVALLLVSLAALFNVYNRLQQSRSQLVSLQLQNQKFANQVNFQENQLNQYKNNNTGSTLNKPLLKDTIYADKSSNQQLMAMQAAELKASKNKIYALERESKTHAKELNLFSDPTTRFIKLKGTKSSPASVLLIAWNPGKKQLWINKKASALPVNDKNHQYQLWAIRKLKPVSLGVFDVRKADSVMQNMMSIDRASAFAVTLEPRGGSKNPTMDQMMTMGLSHK